MSSARRRRFFTPQEIEAAIEAAGDLLDREQARARRGQLDGERQPVEPAAYAGDGVHFRGTWRQLGMLIASAQYEQLDGIVRGQGLQGADGLARNAQRDTACREDA